MSTPTIPPRRIPGPVPKPGDSAGAFYSHVTDGAIDTHRIHNSADEAEVSVVEPGVVDSPPPPLAPSPYGKAMAPPMEPMALPPEPMMPDMMDASMMGGAEMVAPDEMADTPVTPPDGGPPPSNPAEDFLLKGLLQGGGMRKMRPLGR